jgi:hypothetical protein
MQVYIWEEVEAKDFQKKQWTRKHIFSEKKGAISDLKFAPRHWGLVLALAYADGSVNMHAARDLNNLT